MPSFKPEKLRVNLRLSINRLKLLEKKKSKLLFPVYGNSLYTCIQVLLVT